MARYRVYMSVPVEITINDQNVIDRCVNDEDGWRTEMYYRLDTRDKVLEHLAFNAAVNGRRYVSDLDGWADLDDNAAYMHVDVGAGVYAESVETL